MQLAGAVVLVTGSSRGIGAAVAAELVGRDAQVMLHGRSVDQLDALAASLPAKALQADLLDPAAVDRLAAEALDVHGRVDAVVHCAGVGWRGGLLHTPTDTIGAVIGTNLTAPIRLSHALLPAMLARGTGHLAFVGSIAGLVGVADEAVYAASKGGLDVFVESLGLELRGSGVGVSVVHPGPVATDFCAHHDTAYTRSFPRPVERRSVARAVVDGMAGGSRSRTFPRWLHAAATVRALLPSGYRALAARAG